MRHATSFISLVPVLIAMAVPMAMFAEPIRLHPDNQNYFEYRGEATALVTSGEHYGAVLNLGFDYEKYLDTLAADGMNYTRIFAGSYVEQQGAFGIRHNTLAPAEGLFISPWARSDEAGYPVGGNKFDLTRWNGAYFDRLRGFVEAAAERGIIVEVTLFCSVYTDQNWEVHPWNPANNVNGIAVENYRPLHAGDDSPLLDVQEAMVQKIVTELNGYDNVFYEIQNEPWRDQGTGSHLVNTSTVDDADKWHHGTALATEDSLKWQRIIARTIANTENGLENRHLIAQNYCNYGHPIGRVDPLVSIINFHYAWPDAVWWNRGWGRVVGFDESGFAGSGDDVYRIQAWRFMLAGGGLFNNLDYSFYEGSENGLGENRAGGGGSAALRKQLAVLSRFLHGFDFVKMEPDITTVKRAPDCFTHTLSERGRQYAIHVEGESPVVLALDLPAGTYRAEWVNTKDGAMMKTLRLIHAGGELSLTSPAFERDIALRIVRAE